MNTPQNKLVIAIGVLVLILLLGGAYIVVSKQMEAKEVERLNTVKAQEAEILKKDNEAMSKFSTNSTAENKAAYIAQLTQQLANPELTQETKDLLLLRKATNLSVLRGGPNQEAEVREATQIFNDFINKYRGSTVQSEINTRDFAIAAMGKLHLQCCFETSFVVEGYPEYANFSKYATTLGYREDIAKLLTLNDLLKSASPLAVEKDVSLLSERLALSRIIIGPYTRRGLVKPETTDSLAEEVKIILANFNTAQPLTYKDYFNSQIEPRYQYAASYSNYVFYRTKGNLSDEENKSVDNTYETAFASIRESTKLTEDEIAAKSVHYYLFLSYLTSYDTRYGAAKAEAMMDAEIDTFIQNVRSTPELKAQVISYLSKGIGADGKLVVNPNGGMVFVGNKYTKLKNLFAELGLKYTTEGVTFQTNS